MNESKIYLLATFSKINNFAISLIDVYFRVIAVLTWTIYYLAKHQDVQEKLYNSIAKVLDGAGLTCESLTKMT